MADVKDTPSNSLEWLKKKAAEVAAKAEQRVAETPKEMFLPGFDVGAMPNHLNRSSFIAPIARGPRKFHRQTKMVTRSDCVLEYTGEQLDEADGDILMALLFFAQRQPLGTPVKLNRAELLRKLNRSTGKHDYEWLHRRIKAMTEGTIFIESRKPDGATRYRLGYSVAFHIIISFVYDDKSDAYSYTLDPRWVQMFGNREYALLDWDKRMQIGRGQDMAKTLQRLVSTSCNPVQYYALEWLKEKMEYGSPMRKFREALEAAVRELVRLEIVARGNVEDSTKGIPQLVLWLPASG